MKKNPLVAVYRSIRQFIVWLFSSESLDFVEAPVSPGKINLFRMLFGREILDELPEEKPKTQSFFAWLLSPEDLDRK